MFRLLSVRPILCVVILSIYTYQFTSLRPFPVIRPCAVALTLQSVTQKPLLKELLPVMFPVMFFCYWTGR